VFRCHRRAYDAPAMLRHVAVFTLKEGTDPAEITAAVDEVRDRVPGPLAHAYGADAGLRPGNGSFAVTFDFKDEAAYRAWDKHAEHERIRRERIVPHLASVARCQFRV
jgi:hypothetical protein